MGLSKDSKILFVVNQSAGDFSSSKKSGLLIDRIYSTFNNAEILFLDKKFNGLPKLDTLEVEAIIACGGDGTIQSVASQLVDSPILFGIIPLGSGNDFIKSAGIPIHYINALNSLQRATVQKTDVVQLQIGDEKSYFINTLGIGFDGLANFIRSSIEQKSGKFGYIKSILKAAFSQKPFHAEITIDNHKTKSSFLMITLANGHTEGGSFKLTQESSLTDGVFEVIVIKPLSTLGLLLRLPLFLFGLQHRSSKIKTIKARKFEIQADFPIYAHADGEQLGQVRSIKAQIIPQSLNLLVPIYDA